MPLGTVSRYYIYQSRTVDELCRRKRDLDLILFSARQGLQLVQAEWNILRMGNPKYIGQCKLVRFKTIYIESLDTGVSIPLMTDGIINVSVIFNVL